MYGDIIGMEGALRLKHQKRIEQDFPPEDLPELCGVP